LDLPVGGKETAATALRMVFDLVNLCVETPSENDDASGEKTVDYLKTCRRVLRLMCSAHPSSLGLHPAVYLYSWTGKQSPVQFLVLAEMAINLRKTGKVDDFIRLRAPFEAFLVENKSLLNQLVRKYGTKQSGSTHIAQYYADVLALLRDGFQPTNLADELRTRAAYKYLQPEESFAAEGDARGFSAQVKSGVVMRDALASALRCAQCGGYLPTQALSVDHKERLEDGGSSQASNAQLMHPYCNTGYKEKAVSDAKRAT
jgi:hypothetical protein